MFNYLLGVMAISIFNQTYATSSVTSFISRYNGVIDKIMGLPAFSAMIGVIKTLAVGITACLYLMDLMEKTTERDFSIGQLYKATLRCVVSYVLIMNADVIAGYLMALGQSVSEAIDYASSTTSFFANEDNKAMLINGLSNFSLPDILSYIAHAIIPWIISMIGEIVLQVVLISRILEVTVHLIFCPLSIADIYREGTASPGVRYMKKLLALSLQLAVIVLINIATQAITGSIAGADTSVSLTEMLARGITEQEVSGTYEFMTGAAGAASTVRNIFSQDDIEVFLDALVGKNDFLKILGVQLARLGLIWNSMPLCEEITGAR